MSAPRCTCCGCLITSGPPPDICAACKGDGESVATLAWCEHGQSIDEVKR